MKNNIVLAITGMPGAGKSLAADFFTKKDFQYIRFGQATIDELNRKKLPINEANEKKIREDLRKQHGMGAYAKLIAPQVKSLLKKGNVIADGLYSFEEYELFKKEFGEKFKLLAVYASPASRYKRLKTRKLLKSDKSAKNRPLTEKEAKSRDLSELLNLNKGPAIAMADFTIVNETSRVDYQKALKDINRKIRR